ncbi:MAG: HD domain-containing protein [Pseudomonadota bacterium]
MSFPLARHDPTDTPLHPTLDDTAAWAGYWHGGQVDQAGVPYVRHLIGVVRALKRLFRDARPTELHAAWLHDVLEDTDVTPDDLRARGYAPEVIETVTALTRPARTHAPYADWIEEIAAQAPLSAVRVKLADLADNADPRRLAALPDDTRTRLAAKYSAAQTRLLTALDQRGAALNAADPNDTDTVPLMLGFEPMDYWTLSEAAKIADRTPADFVAEESLYLAHVIMSTSSLRGVTLARAHQAKDAAFIDAYRAAMARRKARKGPGDI